MKKLLALVTSILLLASLVLTGCTGTEIRNYEPTAAPTPEATGTIEAPAEIGYEAEYSAYPADEIVMTINGLDVTWSEYFYWLVSIVSYIEYNIGPITNWDDLCILDAEQTQTNREYVAGYALDAITQYRALEHNASIVGAALDEEDTASLDVQWLSDVAAYGGGDEATFVEYLESLYITKELYSYMNEISMLYRSCFEVLYGEKGELCSDEQAAEFAEANSYFATKHILVSTVDAEGAALPDEQLAEKRALAEDILAQLLEAAGDLNAKFDELMNEYSEDPGLLYYPDGYIFTTGETEAPFEEATLALEPGEMSGIVEASRGYHIILRLPLDFDGMVEYYSAEEQYTLRYIAATSLFAATVDGWVEEAADEVVWMEKFVNFDPAELFAS